MNPPRIVRVSGAIAEARPMRDAALYELVRVGERGLPGEVIRVSGDVATIQVYEETNGLALGERIVRSEAALTAQLGPGLLGNVFDGVGRPLARLAEMTGDLGAPGAVVPTLSSATRWLFAPTVTPGTRLGGGDVIGTVEEKLGFTHHVLAPPNMDDVVEQISAGEFSVDDAVARLRSGAVLGLSHRWPIRQARPVTRRLASNRPFVTGQRVFDFLFPVAEGGMVAVPGGFGTGKTVIEQSVAKYGEADLVVYIGCGERGNEMADVLHEFPQLVDPHTGRSIMERTVLVVNTSNMPVAAREASVYLGLTIAEYYRDMGYRVAVLADSLSRWAEALREIGGRLQEMPGEEGYPTYLADRLAQLYERAGRTQVLGMPSRTGAVTFVSAVSPPGGDFSEPVTQASLRVVGGLWALDTTLANERHFPAVNWETSYSQYADLTAPWFAERVADDWPALRREMLELLQRDGELREISALVGPEALEDSDRLLLECAAMLREIVLRQSAFDPADAFSPMAKTYQLVRIALAFYRRALAKLAAGETLEAIELQRARDTLIALRSVLDESALSVEVSKADKFVAEFASERP